MRNREVQWWLLGFLELCPAPLDRQKLTIIKNHLNLARAVEGSLDEMNTLIEEKMSDVAEKAYHPLAITEFQSQLHNSLINRLRMQLR